MKDKVKDETSQGRGRRIAWVTGASRGIGLACATALNEAEVLVVGLDLEISDALAAIAAECREIDVADFSAVEALAKELGDSGFAPDVLVNNAGITRDGVLWKMSEDDWNAVLNVNLTGSFNLMRHAVPLMRSKHVGGSIINISSINGLRGKFGQSNYAASKAGLIGLTKSAARELGKYGIRVNAVAPGMVATEMAESLPEAIKQNAIDETVLGKLARPQDVANCVVFLASESAGHITGQVIQVDGGQYI